MTCSNHIGKTAPALLAELDASIGKRKVISAYSKEPDDGCQESYPCHCGGSLVLTLDDGTKIETGGSTVEIGVIQAHYCPRVKTHWTGYAKGYEKWAKV